MFSNQSAELSLGNGMPLPALDSVKANRSSSQWLVGTSSVRASEDNHLHLVQYYSDANQLREIATLAHATGPVQKIVTCPTDKSLVLTLAEDDTAATLWKMPLEVLEQQDMDADFDHDDNDNDNHVPASGGVTSMDEQAKLQQTSSSPVVDVVWRGGWDEESSKHGDVMTVHADGSLTQWDVAFGTHTATRSNNNIITNDKKQQQPWNAPPRIAWDPHHADLTAVSTGTMVQVIDWRTDPSSSSAAVLSCPHHRFGVTDLDYNPNKPHTLVTSGKDGLVQFWDLRKSTTSFNNINVEISFDDSTTPSSKKQLKKLQPLLVARGGHRHWATRVSYNPFHDQLILSAGADSMVNLWRMSTISSAPLVMLEEEDMAATTIGGESNHETDDNGRASVPEGPNVRVSGYEHMDSVNAIAWGAADAWIYLSASYDGKVVLNHVPSQEKYKILL